MGLPELLGRSRRDQQGVNANTLIPARGNSRRGMRSVSNKDAMRNSVVWGCTSLRAGLVSTLPFDVFRKVAGYQVEVPKPPVLTAPGGEHVEIEEWLYSSQMDLDRLGNTFGIIREVDGADRPARIDLADASTVTVVVAKDGTISYRIDGTKYSREQVWHEKQYTVPGLAVGLSPIAHAAHSLALGQSAQEFALEWFANGAKMPGGHFKNTNQTLDDNQADRIKERFKAAIDSRDVMVTGKDWELKMLDAQASDAQFLQSQKATNQETCRYFGVPGDMVDVAPDGSSVTYANITQRNLQFLIMKLNPVLVRRENALRRLVAPPRFVKFNRSAILQLDPETGTKLMLAEVEGRTLAPSEYRKLQNRAPFTSDQIEEFKILFPSKSNTPDKSGATS